LDLHPEAARSLLLAAHLQLHVLVAGPQGSGKTTWARALHALSAVPDRAQALARADLLGDAELDLRWRPCEQPHHSITAQALVGCGFPLQPGVITRAHGGILLLDEFLEFPAAALEALREPVESGIIELARRGWRRRLPAKFQLVATTNLCPCGKLNPERRNQHSCPHSLVRCRSVCERLSGPVLDRFDMMIFSHKWQQRSSRSVRLHTLLLKLDELDQFAVGRPQAPARLPEHWDLLDLSHRRRQSLLKVARGLADLDGETKIHEHHYSTAAGLVLAPATQVASIFA
jgi:magnesium chelatase family protein